MISRVSLQTADGLLGQHGKSSTSTEKVHVPGRSMLKLAVFTSCGPAMRMLPSAELALNVYITGSTGSDPVAVRLYTPILSPAGPSTRRSSHVESGSWHSLVSME